MSSRDIHLDNIISILIAIAQYNEIRASHKGRVPWYPAGAAATVQPAYPTYARRPYLKFLLAFELF